MDKKYGILFSVSAIASAITASIYFTDKLSSNNALVNLSEQSEKSNSHSSVKLNNTQQSLPLQNRTKTPIENNASSPTANNSAIILQAESPIAGIEKIQQYEENLESNDDFPDNNLLNVQQGKEFFAEQNKRSNDNQLFVTNKKGSGVLIGDVRDAKKLVLESASEYLNLTEQDDLQLINATRDKQGAVSYKFEQSYNGIEVFDRQVIVESRSNNELSLVMGQLQPKLSVNTTPDLLAKEALDNALNGMENAPASSPDILKSPKLLIYIDDQQIAHLTYSSVIKYQTSNNELKIERVFVDAHSGKMIAKISRLHTALNRNIYTLNKQCMSQNMSDLPGTEVAANTDSHTQAAYDNAGISYWFYKHMIDIDSYDDKGIAMRASVHAYFQSPNSNQCSGDNAFFSPDEDQIVYGQGGDKLSNPPSALDISGHEWTHGVTSKTSNLTYQNESGALNESFSDILGSVIEGWKNSGGTENGNPDDGISMTADDWKIGEDVAEESSGWVRFLNNPTQDGRSKDNYNNRYTGSDDNGGVHLNSGINNLAFYLISEGGSHPNPEVSTINVQGIGVEKSVKLIYKSFTHLSSSANFKTAANRVAFDAAEMYGDCSQERYTVQKAYESVNVKGDWTDFTVTDDGICPDTPQPPEPTPPTNNTDNYALGSNAESSSNYSYYYSAAKAVDGNIKTPWVSRALYSPSQSEWLGTDLGDEKSISSVTIKWNGSDYARNVSIWLWDKNLSSWKRVSSTTSGGSGNLLMEFANQSSQYVYVTMSNGNYRRWYAINELEIR
ncbi:MAG: M4 family metallopeptidase [Gammaproteobacteria bacterium]|nr:M4 family metallopeptidase [Gammaproteobacteria bacterium]